MRARSRPYSAAASSAVKAEIATQRDTCRSARGISRSIQRTRSAGCAAGSRRQLTSFTTATVGPASKGRGMRFGSCSSTTPPAGPATRARRRRASAGAWSRGTRRAPERTPRGGRARATRSWRAAARCSGPGGGSVSMSGGSRRPCATGWMPAMPGRPDAARATSSAARPTPVRGSEQRLGGVEDGGAAHAFVAAPLAPEWRRRSYAALRPLPSGGWPVIAAA